MKRPSTYEIKIKPMLDQMWQWRAAQSGLVVASDMAAGYDFAFCAAVAALMQHNKIKDEIGRLREVEH